MRLFSEISVNDLVRVRLTRQGEVVHLKWYFELAKLIPEPYRKNFLADYQPPPTDCCGWSTWQMWSLMQTFGPYMHMGGPMLFDVYMQVEISRNKRSVQADLF